LLCTAQYLRTECYLKKGLREKAKKTLKELGESVRKNINEEDVLIQVPEVALLLSENGERPMAKKLLEVGLKTTANHPDQEWLREKFKEILHQM
jgi:ribosomal protein L31E